MSFQIRPIDYYYTLVEDRPGAACGLLSRLASEEVNLLAFNIVPFGPDQTQLTLFPEHVEGLASMAEKTGLVITGPQRALIVQGDDRLGALVDLHRKLADAGINIFASNGVNDGGGSYGYVIHLRQQDIDHAVQVLSV